MSRSMGRRLIGVAAILLVVASPGRFDPQLARASQAPDEPPPQPAPLDPLPGEPEPVEPPAPLPSEPAGDPAAKLDPQAQPAQAPDPADPLPVALPQPATGSPAPAAPVGDPFMVPDAKLRMGPQMIGLTVDVRAPGVINLNQTAKLQIVVKNTGTAEAIGVVVRDPLPPGVEFVSSVPEPAGKGPVLSWNLGDMAARSERVIELKVKPTKTGNFDHAASVSMLTGGKARSLVQEPLLKVEVRAGAPQVLKGGQVKVFIVVSNPGTGPARNVSIEAKLSSGLFYESGTSVIALDPPIAQIKPGEAVELEPLVADTKVAGPQSCEVTATSPDVAVTATSPLAKSSVQVEVVEAKLGISVLGQAQRFTESDASYTINVKNTGTASAKNVVVSATVPNGARFQEFDPNNPVVGRQNPATRILTWELPQVDPGADLNFRFRIKVGAVGLYPVATQVVAGGALKAKQVFQTDVVGIVHVDLDVIANKRTGDVGEPITYTIEIRNQGTKDARDLQVRAELSKHLKVERATGTDQEAQGKPGGAAGGTEVIFPKIDRLGYAEADPRVLTLTVVGVEPGSATCRVFLQHPEADVPLEMLVSTRLMPKDSFGSR